MCRVGHGKRCEGVVLGKQEANVVAVRSGTIPSPSTEDVHREHDVSRTHMLGHSPNTLEEGGEVSGDRMSFGTDGGRKNNRLK